MVEESTDPIEQFLHWIRATRNESTEASFRFALRRFTKWLKENKLSIHSISPKDIQDYVVFLETEGLKSSTRSHYVVALRSLFRYLEMRDIAPFPHTKIPYQPVKERNSYPPVTQEEYLLMMNSLSPYEIKDVRDKAILAMLWATGVRLGELVSMNISDIDTELRRAKVKTYKRKNHKRMVYWDRMTALHLQKWIDARMYYQEKYGLCEDALFLSLNSHNKGDRVDKNAVQKLIRDLRKHLGIKKQITAHSFRHGFGTRAMKNNVNIRYLQEMLGHAKLNTTMIYMQAENKDVEGEYRKSME